MGIRIKKQIGYFLTNKEAKALFVKDYKEKLENLDADEQAEINFFSTLFNLMENHLDSRGQKDTFVAGYLKREYQKSYTEKKINAYQLISELYFFDDIKGVFLCSMEQQATSRYDDLIDYYENPMTDSIKHLNRPIYPMTGYVYQGGLEAQYPNLIKSEVLEGTRAWMAVTPQGTKQQNNLQKHAKEIVKGKHFTPSIEPLIYMIARAAKVLKDDVTEQQLNSIVKPVIVTHWS